MLRRKKRKARTVPKIKVSVANKIVAGMEINGKCKSATTSIFFRDIDRNTKDLFKAWCNKRGLNMNDTIEGLMKACVRMG